MTTAFQPDAFQNDAFQIIIDVAPILPGRKRKKTVPVVIVNGRVLEYEKNHIEEIKTLLLLHGRIESKDVNFIENIKVNIKTKENIDIEQLLLMLADE